MIPAGVTVDHSTAQIAFKGAKGADILPLHKAIELVIDANKSIKVNLRDGHADSKPMLGTTVRNLENMIHGVTQLFEKKLTLIGVGYRAKKVSKNLELTLGFSHPVVYEIPEDIEVNVEGNTTVVVTGVNKQKVGQVAADIRAYRPPEPYKGKGVRYADEKVKRKETKKKQ